MNPGEKNRELKPGAGHEEIFLAVKGIFALTGSCSGVISEGQAVHLTGNSVCSVENLTDSEAVYVIAGGHSHTGRH